jgi:tight adherence protein B
MTVVILTFVGVLLLIFGAYWALILRPETAAQGKIKKRLRREQIVEAKPSASLSRRAQQLSEIPALNAVLGHTHSLGNNIQTLIDRAGMKTTVGAILLMCAVCGLVAFELLMLVHLHWTLALACGAAATTVPYFYVRYKADKRMQRFEELFPEAIGLIIRSLRAGHAFTTGLAMVAEEMEAPVGPEFRTLYDEQNFGMPLSEALKRLAERNPVIDVKFFVTAVLTQREAGGNLAEVLENLTAVVRDRFKVKRQVRVVTAQARLSGFVLMVLPVVCALIMLVMAPEQMRILWTDPLGIRMSIAAVVLQIVGVLLIRRIVRIEY